MRPTEESESTIDNLSAPERHPDWLDQAAAVTENLVNDGIAHARRELEKAAKPTGRCHFCEAELEEYLPFARYCDEDCEKDHARLQASERRNGRPGPSTALLEDRPEDE